MTALARERFSDLGKTDRRSSSLAQGADHHGQASAVRRFKSWFGSRALGLMGVGGLELTHSLSNMEGASRAGA